MANKQTSRDVGGKSAPNYYAEKLKLSEQPRTVQQILTDGEDALKALGNPVLNLAHRSVVNDVLEQIAMTRPEERNKREDLYRVLQYGSMYMHALAGFATAAQNLNEQQLAAEDRAQRDEHYAETMGYMQ